MIPIAALAPVAEFLAGKLGKAAILALVVGVLVGGYFYWEHKIYQAGYNEAVDEFAQRDAEADTKVEGIKAENAREIETLKKQFAQSYVEGITQYAKENQLLNDQLSVDSGLRLSAKTKTNCADRVPATTNVPVRSVSRTGEVHRVDLDKETAGTVVANAYEVERAKIAVKNALPFIKDNFQLK